MLGVSPGNHQENQLETTLTTEVSTKSTEENVVEKLLLIVEIQTEQLLVMELVAQLLLLLTVEKSNAEKRQEKIVAMNNAPDFHNREVCDDEIEKLISKKKTADEVKKKKARTETEK